MTVRPLAPKPTQRANVQFVDTNVLLYAVVLTEDLNHGQDYDGVRVENPFSGC